MDYAISSVPAAPLRKEPNHRTEMVNQLLFGEIMQVLESKDEWFRIKTVDDQYEGWLTYHLVSEVNRDLATANHPYVTSALVSPVVMPDQQMNVPMGSTLVGFNETSKVFWNNYRYDGSFSNISTMDKTGILTTAQLWINAPYLWGGKTIMGVDCSGFVQTVFKVNGIKLLRDAYQQADQGKSVDNLSNVKEADLAFFQNNEGKIVHVGILMDKVKVIHAAGKVRIDKIDEEGIINTETGKRTHRLHSIRRVL